MCGKNTEHLRETGYFGGCPVCHGDDGYFNVGRGHWFVCDRHRVKWCLGANLFSSWKFETEDEQRRNFEKFRPYREVKPYHPPTLSA